MHAQHSPHARQTRAQARAQAFLTPAPRAHLDGTPEVSRLRAQLDRGPILEGEAPSRKEVRVTFKGPGEDGEEEEENSVEEERSDGTEGVPAPVGVSQGTVGPTLAQSNHQPSSYQHEPSLLAIMQKVTQIMANLQSASSSEETIPPAFKSPYMKASECFDGTQTFKVGSFIQSCQLIFHNYLEDFSQDRNKVLYATSFLIGRAAVRFVYETLDDSNNIKSIMTVLSRKI
ncbi:hypothetical protein O181_114388 [Austropuccinia psidii MF-1]|uniref:Uncharacterized protein n=1 Tax=Austropuccinia psidii MF-1 TaxID=1389203 RepID=A0A9Q3K4B8_9BASI|nr:hypothetical protein [Austropuccinia psidii MF-1]